MTALCAKARQHEWHPITLVAGPPARVCARCLRVEYNPKEDR